MNIDKLQTVKAATTRLLPWRDAGLRIRQLSASDGVAAFRLTQESDDDPAKLAGVYAFILSKSLVGDDGNLDSDSDECRQKLSEFPLTWLIELSEECLEYSGLTDPAKKNESGVN